MFRFFFTVAFLTLILGLGYVIWVFWGRYRTRREIQRRLHSLEEHYRSFLTQRRVLADLQDQSIDSDLDGMASEAIRQLGPELDALLGTIEQQAYASLPQSLDSRLFPNLMSTYRNLAMQTPDTPGLREQDRDAFKTQFRQAVLADLSRKSLQLKTGTAL